MRSVTLVGSRVVSLAAAAAACLSLVAARPAAAQPAVDAVLFGGVDQDRTAIIRLQAGGLYSLGRFAPEAHVGVEGFLRTDSSRGVAARSFTLLDVGARYGILDERFVGPYVSGGGSFGIFTGKPHERKVVGDPDTCETATEAGPPGDCTYRINMNATARLGVGWGFASGDNTTVGVRLDVTYWAFSLSSFERQPEGAPLPREVPRPQDTWSVMLGLEFMRWL